MKNRFLEGNKIEKPALSRREFLKHSLCAASGICLLSGLQGIRGVFAQQVKDPKTADQSKNPNDRFTAEARWWEPVGKDNIVKCKLCPHECTVPDGGRGICEVRENQGGKYKTLIYNRPVSLNVDPIEKKPFFHVLPGTKAFSLATAGCNIECKFCQNWQISQARPEDLDAQFLTPQQIVDFAKQNQSASIAYTYSEPTIYYEYMFDIAKAGKEKGLNNVIVSNGFINEKPLRELCKHLSAVKIDLKSFTEKFYRETCSGQLKPVLHTLEVLKSIGIWYEIVVLIVPTLNDSESEIREMSQWIVKTLGPDVPVHFSRFHPTYKIRNLPDTPVSTIERCHAIARGEGIKFVYTGNVWNHKFENTYCPKCEKLLIRRQGYFTKIEGLSEGKCSKCGEPIPGFWKS